jgi:methyltransferase
MTIAQLVLATVALQRLAELKYASRNTCRLVAQGGIEVGRAHYPLIVGLHAAWLLTTFFALPDHAQIHWLPFGVFLILQGLRLWVMATLGPYWTTRIITLDHAPLVRHGPYRFVRHPNYLIVIGEIAALPLAFGELVVAAIFSVLNIVLLWWRIRQEDQALERRRHPSEIAKAPSLRGIM